MNEVGQNIMSDEELDLLQEIMNIAFGKATAELAELIDIRVELSVPNAKVIHTVELPEYLQEEIKDYGDISIVEQRFWSEFNGSTLLIFPSGSGKELITLLTGEEVDTFVSDPVDELEKGTLMEVGNILIGACIGKIAELLDSKLTYSPPIVYVGDNAHDLLPNSIMSSYELTIALRTSFHFEKKDVFGFLFVLTSQESLNWLKNALHKFLEKFE
jgi:chemotaxis protein CheC